MVEGKVRSVNDNGFKIDDTWYNYGKFYDGERPLEGDVIEVEYQISEKGNNYVKEINFISKVERPINKDLVIARESAARSVCILYAGKDVSMEHVIEDSRKLEDYFYSPKEEVF